MGRTIPIIKIHDNLLVSIQIELSDRLVAELKENICDDIVRLGPHGLIIEVSGVDILDSYIARSIRDIIQIARLMGVQSIVAGLDPAMAVTLVEMGMILSDMPTAINLERALSILGDGREREEAETLNVIGADPALGDSCDILENET